MALKIGVVALCPLEFGPDQVIRASWLHFQALQLSEFRFLAYNELNAFIAPAQSIIFWLDLIIALKYWLTTIYLDLHTKHKNTSKTPKELKNP